jgi:hypothetical protein
MEAAFIVCVVDGGEVNQIEQQGQNRTANFNPDYSRCAGVKTEKACFIGALFQVYGFDSSPTT